MKPKNKLKFSSISDGMKSCKLCLLMKNIWITKKTKLWNKCSISWTGRKNLLPNGSIWMLRIFSSPMKLPTNWQKDCGKEHQLRSCIKVIRWNKLTMNWFLKLLHKVLINNSWIKYHIGTFGRKPLVFATNEAFTMSKVYHSRLY